MKGAGFLPEISSDSAIRGADARSRRLGLIVVLAFIAGCAYVPLPPLGGDRTVRNLDPDEQALWKESRELQHKVEIAGLLFEDPELDAYLAEVMARVTPPEVAAATLYPQVRVISDVNFHGYSFANGVIYIHTALLSRMTNETQLATVLSRELAHVINRHALRTRRDKRTQADTLAWIGVGASVVQGGGTYKLLAQAASITSIAGFHYLLETAADEKGLELLAAAGYDVRDTPAFFQMTVDHLAEVHSQGLWGWVAFNPPAAMTARIAGYENLIATRYADERATRPPIADSTAFRRKMLSATIRQVDLELAAGLFVSAEITGRLAVESNPKNPRVQILLGRALAGQRGKPIPGRPPPSIQSVRACYEEALRLAPRNPIATRELGMSYYRTTGSARSAEATAQALRYLRRYLSLQPNASDADYVRVYIGELETGSR